MPATRPIIKNGAVVLREPGNVDHIKQRIVIAEPMEMDGKVYPLAVSVHETRNGQFKYDFTFDRDADFTVGAVPRVYREGRAATDQLPSFDVPLLNADGNLNIELWPVEGNVTDFSANPPTAAKAAAKDESRLVQEIKGIRCFSDTGKQCELSLAYS